MTAFYCLLGAALILSACWLAFSRAPEGEEIPGVGFVRGNWHEGDE